MEFHVSRQARDRYDFDESLFSFNGNVIFANFHASRKFAQRINQKRDLVTYPEQSVRAGQINAMGLIDEILHYVVQLFREQMHPQVMQAALSYLEEQIGVEEVDNTLRAFGSEFPVLSVYREEQTIDEYFEGETDGRSHRAELLEEMLLLWLANKNPAFDPYGELFDDSRLSGETAYRRIIRELHAFFDTQPSFGPENQNLIDMLRSPSIAVPHSLTGQLEYIRERWRELLGKYLYRLLSSLDLVREEEKLTFSGPGPVPIPVYDRASAQGEPERFSADRDWMVRLVMIAKNAFVWLDQLSKQYGRSINRLDQIPDEELEKLAQSGFTGLWLIGLWERSQASARIKQIMGNAEAVASAYSLADYRIAGDLGGESAYQNLSERAWRYGIRLASDMVPNHMGIDSSWVMEHPERFIQQEYSPFPGYSFSGPDLSNNDRVGIYLEDHYYSRTDAAVVFKQVDKQSGQERYIYHGNDGTSMPWNDTAQLNYLMPEVREAVIQTILEVARKFPIIRFDAAMTLAKKHYQRLWFPQPGSGGDIPSRAEHSMTKEQFDALMPEEFWREVVDRVAAEVPDTLLLAEAFWMMEGFFVRSLGMHRVYNSAFMNLLRNEDNAKYREVMKNTLEFDLQILKRFVNFMNNPDERTAVDQFGKGDKYFGTCVMMVTLPGLPMFGHGQIEGFTEKYGMEFRRAYWEETPDEYLVERHRREIFPIMHRRAEFAGVENFLLYDFFTIEGAVNEDVYAFSNGLGDQRNLVVFHNHYGSTAGWIRTSVGYVEKIGDERRMQQRSLAEGLRLSDDPNSYVLMRDLTSGLEYIHPSKELVEQGLYIALDAYKYHVFADIRVVQDDEWQSYRQLYNYLGGRGVASVQDALRELILQPVQHPFRQIANPGYFNYLLSSRMTSDRASLPEGLLDEAAEKMSQLLRGIGRLTGESLNHETILSELRERLEMLLSLETLHQHVPVKGARKFHEALTFISESLSEQNNKWLVLFGWVFLHNLGKASGGGDEEDQALTWMDEWQLSRILAEAYLEMGYDSAATQRMVDTVRMLISQQCWYSSFGSQPLETILQNWLADETVRRFLGVNRFKDVLWFSHDAFVDFVWWMDALNILELSGRNDATSTRLVEQVLDVHEIMTELLEVEEESGYQVNKLLEAAEK